MDLSELERLEQTQRNDVADVLRRARELWESLGGHCVETAIYAACDVSGPHTFVRDMPNYRGAIHAFMSAVGIQPSNAYSDIWKWYDRRVDRSESDIRAVFDRAIELAERR